MRAIRIGVAAVILMVAGAAGLGQGPRGALAEGTIFGEIGALSGGESTLHVAYAGTTTGTPDRLGDMIEFRVQPAAGSGATAVFANGQTTFTAPLGGTACQAEREDVSLVTQIKRCFAAAALTSVNPGKVDVIARNTQPGHQAYFLEESFVPPRALTPRAAALNSGYGTTLLAIQNTGPGPAVIVAALYNSTGEERATRAVAAVPPGGSRIFELALDPELSGSYVGTVVIGSDQPVAAVAYHGETRLGQVRRSIASAFPYDTATGTTTTSLPYVANALENTYNTKITMVNTGTTRACVKVTYTFVPGAGAVGAGGKAPVEHKSTANGPCPTGRFWVVPRGSVTISPPPDPNGVAFPAETRNTLMSATLEAEGGRIGAVVTAYTSDSTVKEASYEGFRVSGFGQTDISRDVALPLALKTTDGYYTQVLFSNPNPTAADVTITYRGSTGTHVKTVTVPAGGVTNHSTYSDSVVPSGFIGAARISSSQPIAAVLFRAKKVNPASDLDESLYTAVNGLPADQGRTTLYFPLVFRRVAATASLDGINSWISIITTGGGRANLTLRTIGGCAEGTADELYTATKTIDESVVFYQNGATDNGFGGNTPACFAGGVTITSDVPILGVASYINDLFPGDGEAVYSGFAP